MQDKCNNFGYFIGPGKREITGVALKCIAASSMLLDHIGAILVYHMITEAGMGTQGMIYLYYLLRCIGRLAFPIYLFLLIEGFTYTRNRGKYLRNLCIFALVSELPFNMGFFLTNAQMAEGRFTTFDGQNVFFTLTLGLLLLIIWDTVEKKIDHQIGRIVALVLASCTMALATHLLHTDYSASGILALAVMYAGRNKNKTLAYALGIVVLAFFSSIELIALLSVPLIYLYRGTRGRSINKWAFYLFYPVHIRVLVLIRYLLF